MEDLFDSYKGYIKTFCDNLKGEVEKIINSQENYGGKVHICAISRKMPKLLDILHDDLKEIWDRLIIITEISLPFVDWNNMKVILLTDDAIYYGSTFSAVYRQIKGYSTNIRIVPICCIKASEVTLPFEAELKTTSVERAVGHYFVNCLSIIFRKQCTPFEVEFPVFQALLPKNSSFDTDTFISALQKAGLNVYQINNYVNQIQKRRNEKGYSFELGIDLSKDGRSCKKIRLYIKDDRIFASSICTTPVLQQCLARETVFEGTMYEQSWQYIYDKINSRHKDVNSYKTLCVAFNFLYSLDAFDSIHEVLSDCVSVSSSSIEKISFNLRKRELLLLYGNDIADYVYAWYKQVDIAERRHDTQIVAPQAIDGVPIDKEYLPQDFKLADYYNTIRSRLLRNFKSISGFLMSIFYVQNAMLDKTNRMFYLLSSERLKYGQTYGSILSIIENAGIPMSEKQNWVDVHKWVDARIDCATIVPQYIVSENFEGQKYWHRVFRSGENELYFISHWARLCITIFVTERNLTGRFMFEKKYFSGLISWIYKRFLLKDYFYDDASIKYEAGGYHIYTHKEKEGEETMPPKILDLLCKLYILQMPKNGFLCLNEDLLDPELATATILPEDVKNKIINELEELHESIPNIANYKYYVPFFDATLYDGSPYVDKSDDFISCLFEFMKSTVNGNHPIQTTIQDYTRLKRHVYIRMLESYTHNTDWFSQCKDCTFEVICKKTEEIIQNTEGNGAMLLLKIFDNIIFDDFDKFKLLALLKGDGIGQTYLRSYISGTEEKKMSCQTIFKKILSQGESVWRY